MPEAVAVKEIKVKNIGWRVTFAGMGINLALGLLYSWSIISSAIEKAGWGWTAAQRSLPYSIACLTFSLIMVPAGRMQDKLSPRLVASIGGLLVGAGMMLTSMSSSNTIYLLTFGVLVGAGIGFGYASATPPSIKWFPPAKTGLIAGLVVSGFGLASVYIAPLGNWMIGYFGISKTVFLLGIGFLVIVVGLAQLLKTPPEGYVPEGSPKPVAAGADVKAIKKDFAPNEMLKTWQFYMIWFMYACGSGVGLMVISIAKKVNSSVGVGVLAVVALAIGNGAGRIVAGIISDKIGRKKTMFVFFMLQAVIIFLLSLASIKDSFLSTKVALIILSALVGANYGSNLTLFPSITKDFFGLKNFGMNYGLVFTSWGVGGFALAQLAGKVYDKTQTFTFAYYSSIILLVLAGTMVFLLKPPKTQE